MKPTRRRAKDSPDTSCIKDWKLEEEERIDDTSGDIYYYLEIPAICRIYSEESLEECRSVLRAVLHTWMHLELAKSQVPLHNKQLVKREKALLIHRVPKAAWEWGWNLQGPANLYNLFEGRARHKAIFVIQGNIWRFESKLNLVLY